MITGILTAALKAKVHITHNLAVYLGQILNCSLMDLSIVADDR